MTENTKTVEDKRKYVELLLFLGPWKRLVPPYWSKVIIAKALNKCDRKHGLRIKGYIITHRKIGLVLDNEKEEVEHILEEFKKYVYKQIKRHLNEEDDSPEDLVNFTLKGISKSKGLFRRTQLFNDHLVNMLMDKPLKIDYYSPHLARLKDYLHRYDFCSVQDYRGAKGPVKVKVKKKPKT